MEKRAQKKILIWTGTRLVCYKAIKKERKNTWQRKEQEKNKERIKVQTKDNTQKQHNKCIFDTRSTLERTTKPGLVGGLYMKDNGKSSGAPSCFDLVPASPCGEM